MDPFTLAFLTFLARIQKGFLGALAALEFYLSKYPEYLAFRLLYGPLAEQFTLEWLLTSSDKFISLIYFILILDVTTFTTVRLEQIAVLIQRLLDTIIASFTRQDDYLAAFKESLLKFLTENLSTILEDLDEIIVKLGPEGVLFLGIKRILLDLAKFIEDLAEKKEESLRAFYTTVRAELETYYTSQLAVFKAWLVGKLKLSSDAVIAALTTAIKEARLAMQTHFEGVVALLEKKVGELIDAATTELRTRLYEVVSDIKEDVGAMIGILYDQFKAFVKGETAELRGRLYEVLDDLKRDMEGFVYGLAERFEVFIKGETAEISSFIETTLMYRERAWAEFLDDVLTRLRYEAEGVILDLKKSFLEWLVQLRNDLATRIYEARDTITEHIDGAIALQSEVFRDWYNERLVELKLYWRSQKAAFLSDLQAKINTLRDELKDWILNQVKTMVRELGLGIEAKLIELLAPLTTAVEAVGTTLTAEVATLTAAIAGWTGELATFLTAQAIVVAGFTAAIALIEAELLVLSGAVATAISTAATSARATFTMAETLKETVSNYFSVYVPIKATLEQVNEQLGSLVNKVEEFPSRVKEAIKEALKEFKDELKKWLEDLFKGLKDELASAVADRVVGESFYKWNSMSSYYPTLVCIFREEGPGVNKRRCQIKVQLPFLSDSITDQDLAEIRRKLALQTQLGWRHGTIRSTYVSPDKKFKTSVFVNSRQDAKTVLAGVCSVAGVIFDARCISFTEGRHRVSITRRTRIMENVPLLEADYTQPFNVKLFKAAVLINGLERPITVFIAS